MRVAVTGDRHYTDKDHVFEVLDRLSPSFLVSGGATGVDEFAYEWAKANLPETCRPVVKAEWKKFGLAAGPIRNQKMLDTYCLDFVIAFPGNRGTADMVRRAKQKRVAVKMYTKGPLDVFEQ